LGIPDEVWHELRSYGAPQPVDAKQALIDDVKAFVQDYRRLPKQSRTDKKEKCLADRLRKYKSNLDNAQLVELLECEDAVEDAKKIGWRLLLDEAKAFVRDFGRWPKANDTHIKEDVLATRLAKGKKEFDSVHRTELQDLEKRFQEDTRQRAAEGLVKEVKELGHYPTHVRSSLTEWNLAQRVQRALGSTQGGASQPAALAELQALRQEALQDRAAQMLKEAEQPPDPMQAFADEACNKLDQELLILSCGDRTRSLSAVTLKNPR
jgi:hypothetical protein